MTELLESALKLSVEERLQLVKEIWNSIATQEAPLSAPKVGIRRAQALVRAYIAEGRFLSDELIEERHREK